MQSEPPDGAVFAPGAPARLPPFGAGQSIGLLGGSFNPPHEGHRLISELALRRLRRRFRARTDGDSIMAWPWDGSGPAEPAAMPGRAHTHFGANGLRRHRIACLKHGIIWF